MGRLMAFSLGVWALAAPAAAHSKRADRCGCHHQYGLVHCHPNLKTKRCEAPVSAVARTRPAPKPRKAARPAVDLASPPQAR